MGFKERIEFFVCENYRPDRLKRAIAFLLEKLSFQVSSGTRVLVKPNLVSARNAALSCTHPEIVRAVCEWLIEKRAEVTVGDSPAFGTTRGVARAAGLVRALSDLPVKIVSFSPSRPIKLACGVTVKLAREALCADLIVNLPRFKAHDQLLLTLAVKNLFGCVVGLQKPLFHARFGERGDLFYRVILEVSELLPVGLNLMDAIVAMEGRGPTTGRPKNLGLLWASRSAVALDTAIYLALDLSPEEVPLWQTAQKMRLYGARPEEVAFPSDFPDLSDFRLPEKPSPVSFHPLRLIRGILKRLLMKI
ncbi:DUF362 domain-containing protein [Thermosulfurimonas dismutans]|uniref:DUF362 domain-containing protein n=1 Tax=Thermosulfurimonas dismutans TaxID=999894 RepID=A0A179D2D5_9BACT|nr:DUF362 domain-containing protein [Thermosulfurimonas dismutans]OAQ20217.1 hypothetical protein TDIS_1719 [Thermosulfurimonas dismutans]